MKKRLFAVTLMVFIGIVSVFADQSYFQILATSIRWSVEHESWVIYYRTTDRRIEYIVIGKRNPNSLKEETVQAAVPVNYEVNFNISQRGFVNNNEHYSVTIRPALNEGNELVEQWLYEINSNAPDRTVNNSHDYLLAPGTENVFKVTAILTDGETVSSLPKSFTAPELPAATIDFYHYTNFFDFEQNKAEIRLTHSTNRNDAVRQNELIWKVNGETISETTILLTVGEKHRIEVIHETLGISKQKDIEISIPYLYSPRQTLGDYDEQNRRAVTLNRPDFSANVINLDKGEFKLTVRDSGEVMVYGSPYYFARGRHTVVSEYFNSSGELIVSRTDTVTVENPPLKVSFDANFAGHFDSSSNRVWKSKAQGLGTTTISSPVSDVLRGPIEADIEITTQTITINLSGRMASANHGAEIIQAGLTGISVFNERTGSLRCSVSGDVFLRLSGSSGGISLEGKTLRIPVRRDIELEVVEGKEGYELKELNINGIGNEFSGSLPPLTAVSDQPQQSPQPLPQPQQPPQQSPQPSQLPQSPQPSRVLLINNWYNGMVELRRCSTWKEQRVIFYYDTENYSVKKIVLYWHEPSVRNIFPGQAAGLSREIAKQLASELLEIF